MMHSVEGMTQEKAYDIVRREFYALRQEEDVERRIAKEEAMKVGAYFGKSHLQVGMELEDQQYENWKKWASKQIQNVQAEQDAAYTNFGATEEADVDSLDLDAEEAVAEIVTPDSSATASANAAPRR
jgi:small subunit ribosomal protein S23